MDGIQSVQDLDKFLASPLPKQEKQPNISAPPKPPLPQVNNVQDLDKFLKTPIQQYDLAPVEKYKTAQRTAAEHPDQATISATHPEWWERMLDKVGHWKVAGNLTLRQAWERSNAPLGDTGFEDRKQAEYQKFLKDNAGKSFWSMASLEALGMGAENAAFGLFTPQNMLMLAGMGAMNPKSALKSLVDAGFTAQMATGLVEGAPRISDAIRQGDARAAIYALTNEAVLGGFAYMSGKGLMHDVELRSRAIRMRESALARLDEVSKAKYNKPWNDLTRYEQADITYGLANTPNAPISADIARRMGIQMPADHREAFPKAVALATEQARAASDAREVFPPFMQEIPQPPTAASRLDELNNRLNEIISERNDAVRRKNLDAVARLDREKAQVYGEMDALKIPVGTGLSERGLEMPPSPTTGMTPEQQVEEQYALPDNESAYMSPEERSQRYYTLEEARKRLDEERRIAAQEQETRKSAESELDRIAREKKEQTEGERAYREAREGKRLVVSERRGLSFDEAGAESNRQEGLRITDELNRLAEEGTYSDADEMVRSIETEKTRGQELDEWKKNILKLDARRKDLVRLSNPELLEPTRTQAFQGLAEDVKLAGRESDMREAAARIETEAKKQTDAEEFERMTADAEEAKQRAEDLRTERDRKEAQRVAATAERQEYPLGALMDMVKGTGGNVILPDGRKIPFHYAVVPLDSLISSHDPFNNFEPNPQAIQISQGRDYKNNRESQAATIARGKNPEMELLVNTSPTAETGPPIVRSDGQAMGGRNRVNIWKLLYKNGFEDRAYQYMVEHAREYGVTPEQIANYYTTGQKPVVVRVLDEPYTTADDLARLGRDLDRTQTMGFSAAEEAVMAGRSLSDKTLEWVSGQLDAMGEYASLRELMRMRGNEIVDRMLESDMISPTQRAEFVTSSGEMTEKGKNLFESAVLGKVVDDPELLATAPKEVMRKLERSVAALARVKAAGGAWDFTPELKTALQLWKRIDSIRDSLNEIGTKDDSLVDKYLHPGEYKMGTELMQFGGETVRETPHPTVETLAKLLEKPAKEIKIAVGDYADDAEGRQITLGPAPSAVESFNRNIAAKVKMDVPDDAWGVLRPAQRPPESVSRASEEGKGVKGGIEAPEAPRAIETQPLPPLEPVMNAAKMESVLAQRVGPEQARSLMTMMEQVVKVQKGASLDDVIKKYFADVRLSGKPGASSLEQSVGDLSAWARRAGRKLEITDFGEQMGLFGGGEPQYVLRNRNGDERLVLKSELLRMRDQVPRIAEMVDSDGNVRQGGLFGVEEENLFGPGEEEEPPQGTLFQSDWDKTTVGTEMADTGDFSLARKELFPGKETKDLSTEELRKVINRANEIKKARLEPKLLFQEKQGPWIYKSEQVLQGDKLANVQSGAQWAAFLKNKGVKADELKWMGVDDFLAGRPKVTKQELLDFIHQNQLQLTEVAHDRGVQYEQYTLSGEKKNYTELLFTLPSKFPETADPYEARRRRIEEGHVEFTSSHFGGIPNILAHVRFDERTDAQGRRVLFVEEVQSDWHQKGKKYGYQQDTRKPTSDDVFAALRKAYKDRRTQFGDGFATEAEMKRLMREPLENSDVLDPADRQKALADAGFPAWTIGRHGLEMVRDLVPDAPFKTDWHEMVMRRMLREAVDRGFDKIAWVTGEQTADRYDLSKTIQTIGYQPVGEGRFRVTAQTVDGKFIDVGTKTESELADAVGKDVAARIARGEGEAVEGAEGQRLLSGLQLKTGGEWAKNLYDQAIPNFMRKYGKKWDARVQDLELGEAAGHGEKVHSMEITPAMRKSVMEGQPLFQEKKGATEFLDDGRAVMYLFKKADASTFLHEFFHVMRRWLDPEDLKVLEDWLKIKDGTWTRSDEEKAARAWEYYHHETKPQTLPEKVAAVFKKIQTVMRQIYEQLKGSPLVKPSKEVSALFDRWYGRDMEAMPGLEEEAAEEKPTKYKFGNTQANLPPSSEAAKAANEARNQIADEDLAGKGKDVGDGGNHVTVRYGIKGEDTDGIRDFLAQQRPIEARLGKTEMFPPSESSDGAAVIIAPVEAPELHLLNKELENHGDFTEPTFKEYRPHVTIAYVKPEAASKYVGMDVTDGKTFTIDQVAIITKDGKQSVVKFGTKPSGEKIAAAADLEAPPLSPEERKNLTLRYQFGTLPLDTGKVRVKVFPELQRAADWAKANKDKIKGGQVFTLPDGRAVADFVAKKPNVLFQSDYERELAVATINWKISGLRDRMKRIVSNAERASINRQIRDLGAKREAIKSAPRMEPPPGEVITLWTPEGERPIEATDVTRKQEVESPRTVPDEATRLSKTEGLGRFPEQPRLAGSGAPEPTAGGGVRDVGRGTRERGTITEPRASLPNVRPLSVQPVRERGEPAYSAKDWADKVAKFLLPSNAPAPTVQISDELARMLMPGQREVVESALSGLKQHDGYILATSTGTGKTFTSSAILKSLQTPESRMLVLTPSQQLIHGRDGWINVAGNFGLEVKPLTVGELPTEPGIYIATWAGALNREGIAQYPWDVVVMDEVQEARKWWTSQRGAMSHEMGTNAKKIMYTSATPFHTALELGHMNKLGLWGREGFETWAMQNGLGVYRDKAGNLAGGNAPMKLDKLRDQLIERGQMININRNMDGYSAHFGVVPMDGQTAQGLANIDKALTLAENYFARTRPSMVPAVSAQRTTLAKRWLEYQRLPQAIELGKKLENEGWKAIFFSENKKEFTELFDFLKQTDAAMNGKISELMPKFGSVTDKLREAFGDDIALFAGKHSSARNAEIDAFNDDEKSHLYATYGAGGVGVSMHDRTGDKPRAVIYLGPPWSGISFDQALGRPWRYGTKSNVRAYFLFSDAQAEMDLVTNKVAPRMEALRAMVSGVNFEDPVVKNLREVPVNIEGALDYDHGNAHVADFIQFTKRRDISGVSSFSELPIVSAEEAKNKGMRLPGGDGMQNPAVVRLWQDSPDEEVIPADFEAPELTLGRKVNVELADRFIETGAAPGMAAGRTLDPIQRRIVADAILARADAAAAGDPASATQQVYTEWENGMKQMDAFLSATQGGGMEPPPSIPGVPGVPGGDEPISSGGSGPPNPPDDFKLGSLQALKLFYATNGQKVIREVAKKAGAASIGEEIAGRIPKYHVYAGQQSGPLKVGYFDICQKYKITPAEHDVIAYTLANRDQHSAGVDRLLAEARAKAPMNDRVAKAVDEITALMRDIHKKLQDKNAFIVVRDGDTGKPRRVYYSEFSGDRGFWPRSLDWTKTVEVVDKETGVKTRFNLRDLIGEKGQPKRERMINAIMERTGRSRASVEDWLARTKRQVPLAGHLERSRESDMPWFRTDIDAVMAYFEDVGEILSRIEHFGQEGEKVNGLIAQIPNADARQIVGEVVNSLLQRDPMREETRRIMKFATNWAVLKMAYSGTKVLTHSVHGALNAGMTSYMKGLFNAVTDRNDAWRLAKLNDSIGEQTRTDALSAFGINRPTQLSQLILKWNGWQTFYRFGRVTSDATARVYMTDYAMGKLLKDPQNGEVRRMLNNSMQLSNQQIDAAISRKKWTEDELAWGAKAFTDKIMFSRDPTTQPPGWTARAGSDRPVADMGSLIPRMVTLLKGYQFRTHALLYEYLWGEARHGNLKPLIRFVPLYAASGQLILTLGAIASANTKYFQQLLDDKSWEPGNLLKTMAKDVAAQVGDAFMWAYIESMQHRGPIGSATNILLETAGGPLYSDTKHTIELPEALAKAKSAKSKEKAVKRYVESTLPEARTLINLYESGGDSSRHNISDAPVMPVGPNQ